MPSSEQDSLSEIFSQEHEELTVSRIQHEELTVWRIQHEERTVWRILCRNVLSREIVATTVASLVALTVATSSVANLVGIPTTAASNAILAIGLCQAVPFAGQIALAVICGLLVIGFSYFVCSKIRKKMLSNAASGLFGSKPIERTSPPGGECVLGRRPAHS